MFKGNLDLCKQEEFKFYDFYNLIGDFKNKVDLTSEDFYGKDTKIIYRFNIRKDTLWFKLDCACKYLAIDIEADCTLDNFNFYYKTLQDITNLMYKK